ncbi:MAG: hypothetical protein HZB99_04405 [Candidatus Harrisonbacteria bacterium]|nr:hypothetical protein [Candidatus Harrisonbacteria bacterium]
MNVETLMRLLWLLPIVALLFGYKLVLRVFGVVLIPEDSLGVVNKKFVIIGKNRTLPDGAIVALNGEAGLQADTLAPGVHFWLWPWQYLVTLQKFTTIQEGKIGVVESSDGRPLAAGRVLAKKVDCNSFQDARTFLQNGGERGPQITVIPPGTYRINTALFSVTEESVLEIDDNMVGVVTTKEGKSLKTGEIAGGEIQNHNMFQDGQAFLDNGGFKGLQEQVMLAGRYFINPRFATVELKEMTTVPIAHVGVVIAYVGAEGVDVSGKEFKHGNLVSRGQKGVWADPLDPGKYPINPYTHKLECVPTANVVLNWATGKTESHKLDEKLSTITVRSSDGFSFNLDVSQIIHIPRNDAPLVIARFGNVANLVTQVLEPTIGNYFRNAAQSSDVIEFLKARRQRQEDARKSISEALQEYNVGAVNTLIGDIVPPAELMKTLTDRKLAEQEKVTYETQRLAEVTRKELEQAKAQAATQAKVVDAERSVAIAEFTAQAAVKQAEGEAASKTVNAKADAEVLTVVGKAQAEKTTAVGTAEAEVIQKKTNAVGQSNYAIMEVGRALADNKIKLVPDIMAGGTGNGDGGNSLVNVLLAGLIQNGLKNGNGHKEPPAQG